MIEDQLLKLRFRYGSSDALQKIYQKYLNYLLTLAMALLHNQSDAEDVVHDTFVHFVESADNFKLTGNLKSYLTTCVINRARDKIRANQRRSIQSDQLASVDSVNNPDVEIVTTEESQQLNDAISRIPQQQREVIVLHLISKMKFREIAKFQGVSVNTIQGRYRYALEKLRSLLNGEVKK
jgi:RNA polymerase sigma factor (sigma-70 family)